jgi:hypothetical protein
VISVGRRAPRLLDEQHIAAPAGNEAIPAEATGSDREGGA